MTPFEAQSLAIAHSQLVINIVYTAVAAVAAAAAIVGGVLIHGQLQSSRWLSLLMLEQDMAGRRDRFLSIKQRIGPGEDPRRRLKDEYDLQKENYLNSVERLASSVLNGSFPQKEMKQDYRELISSVVREFPDEFRAGTRRRKTLKLNELWED